MLAGYDHRPRNQRAAAPDEQVLPRVHHAVSSLKSWLQGTHRGVTRKHLSAYLHEFVLRFNRRATPMAAFQTLLGLETLHEPTTYRRIVEHNMLGASESTG